MVHVLLIKKLWNFDDGSFLWRATKLAASSLFLFLSFFLLFDLPLGRRWYCVHSARVSHEILLGRQDKGYVIKRENVRGHPPLTPNLFFLFILFFFFYISLRAPSPFENDWFTSELRDEQLLFSPSAPKFACVSERYCRSNTRVHKGRSHVSILLFFFSQSMDYIFLIFERYLLWYCSFFVILLFLPNITWIYFYIYIFYIFQLFKYIFSFVNGISNQNR